MQFSFKIQTGVFEPPNTPPPMRLVNGHYVPKGKCANLGDNTDEWKVSEGMMMENLDYEKGMKGHFDKTILLCLKIHFFIR